MKRNVYVAGKMRGLPYYNFPAFDKARDRLAGLGLTPLSPADMDRAAGFDPYAVADEHVALGFDPGGIDWSVTPPSFDLAAAIARDNAAIDDPDTVAVYVIHEGISESAGGMAEIERGMKRGLVILYDTMSDERILRALGLYAAENVEAAGGGPVAVEAARIGYRVPSFCKTQTPETEAARAMNACAPLVGAADKNTARSVHVGPYCSPYGAMPPGNSITEPPVNLFPGDEALRRELAARNERAAEEKRRAAAGKTAQTFFSDPVTGGQKDGRYTERGGVLDEAKSLICGDRNSQYGPPSQDFERTAGMMNALFGHMLQEGKVFKSRDVAWIMMMVKASRSQHAPKRDNYVDAAGYAACGWECETETQKKGDGK